MAFRYESPTIARAALALGIIGFGCICAMTGLAWNGRTVPDALASIGGGAVGALATLLTTFTPSPLPGGRRTLDADYQTTTVTTVESTDTSDTHKEVPT
jgi:hypothetical protein